MQKMSKQWIKLFEYAQENPLNFSLLNHQHQIKKLDLYQLEMEQIKEKVKEFSLKYETISKYNTKIWMENEFRIFIWTVFYVSKMKCLAPLEFNFQIWNDLSAMFNKSPILCYYFYRCTRKGKSACWTTQEDQFLRTVMANPQYESKWTDIGLLLFVQSNTKTFHTPKSIRQRWLNHLNPTITKEEWSLNEDLLIIEFVLDHGKKWSKLSKILSNRSQHAVKNRYNSLVLKNSRSAKEQLRRTEENRILRRYKKLLCDKLNIKEGAKGDGEKDETTPQSIEANSMVFYYFCPSMGFGSQCV